MSSFRGVLVLAVAGLLVVCGLAAVLLNLRMTAPEDFWASGSGLTVSERGYILGRAARLLEKWQSTRAELYTRRGEQPPPYNVYLVVDLHEPAMWIERDGQVWEGWRLRLLDKLNWTMRRQFVGATEPLPTLSRFKIRGRSTAPEMTENVSLIGYMADSCVRFTIKPSGEVVQERGSGAAPLMLPPISTSQQKAGGESYPSIVVSDAEYLASSPSPEGTNVAAGGETGPDGEPSWLAQNRSDWRAVEAKLYREIERQVGGGGLRLRQINVEPGPDFHAGHAEIQARRSGLSSFLHGSHVPEIALNIEFLGEGVWYAWSVPGRRLVPRAVKGIDLEFVVPAADELPGDEAKWIARGRAKQSEPRMPTPWVVVLANGARLEFLGVCRAPSLGRKWWKPDGSPLEGCPYISTRTSLSGRDREWFEIAMRTIRSGGISSQRCQVTGNKGSGSYACEDRYGWRLRDVRSEQYLFPEGQETTTVRVGLGQDRQNMEWVEFRNVSLVPGRDFGFEIAPISMEN